MTEWERMQKGLIYNDFDYLIKEQKQKSYLKPIIKQMMKKSICEIIL